MARLYADEDFDFGVVEELRKSGHDVVTVKELGRAADPDPKVLADAIADERAVVTFNRRHFIRMHTRTPTHKGIIVCTRDPDIDALSKRIDEAIAKCSPLDNLLVRIKKP